MIAAFAKHFELTERTITAKALRWTRIKLLLSAPVVPLIFWIEFFGGADSDVPSILVALVLLIGSVALVAVAASRFVNRFWFPDKYLDEWEIRIKHKSMVFAMQCTLYLTMALAFGFMFAGWPDGYVLKDFTTQKLSVVFTALLLFVVFLQSFKALSLVQPMEEDELDGPVVITPWYKSKFLWIMVAFIGIVIALSTPHIVASYQKGFIYGYSKASCEKKGLVLDSVGETKEGYSCKPAE